MLSRIGATIEHSVNDNFIILKFVINRVGKLGGEQTVVTIYFAVYTRIESQRFDFSKNAVQKINADASFAFIVEVSTLLKILEGRGQYPRCHR